jgi:hypothetical protein
MTMMEVVTISRLTILTVSRLTILSDCHCSFFTNEDAVKGHHPYAQLGLTWGVTTTEIKEAYHEKV